MTVCSRRAPMFSVFSFKLNAISAMRHTPLSANFTSTFYSSLEIGASGPITDESELVFGVSGELDFFHVEVVDDDSRVVENVHYDATVVRAAFKTLLTDDLDGYAQLKLRIPVETFVFEAQQLYVIPMLEIGGTWTF